MKNSNDAHTIAVEHLTKRYGDHLVVDDLTFTVEPGKVTGFLGPNGSGKSTTMKMMLDLATADRGRATIAGQRYRELPTPSRTVGAMIESDAFHPGRSGRNHLRILADATGVPLRRVDEVLEEVGLTHAAGRHAGAYSLGMQARIEALIPELDAMRRLAAARDTLDLGHWPLTCLDHPAPTPAEADRILRSAVHAIPSATTSGRPGSPPVQPRQIGTLGPWPVLAIRDWSAGTITIDATTYGLRFQLPIAIDDFARDSDRRIWQRIINRPFRGIATATIERQDELRRLQSNLAQADHDADNPFPQQSQLDELRARLAEVEDKLMPATQADATTATAAAEITGP